MGIKSVVDDENVGKASSGFGDAMCSVCEMAVVWMQNQIKQNQTQEQILNYVNQVKQTSCLHSSSYIHYHFFFVLLFIIRSVQVIPPYLHLSLINASYASDCLAQWENQQLIVTACLPCLM